MVEFNSNYTCNPSEWGNKTNNPIILQCCDNSQFTMPKLYSADKFEKKKENDTPIEIDPNDKFVLNELDNDELKDFASPQYNQKLCASINPPKAKEIGKDCWKWGRRIWTGLEVYDTIEGYKERMENKPAEA